MEYYRGDVVFVSKGKYVGCEQGGERPAVIVSNNTGNHFSDCVEIVYLTSAAKKDMPTHVDIVCKCMSTALCEQIYTVSKERITEYIRSCTVEEMRKIDDALLISLGIDKETPIEKKNEAEPDSEADERIEALKAKIEEQKKFIGELEEQTEVQKKIIFDMTDKAERVDSAKSSEECIKMTAERDVYKSLYDDLLKKVTG